MFENTAQVRVGDVHRIAQVFHVELRAQIFELYEVFHLFNKVSFVEKFRLTVWFAYRVKEHKKQGGYLEIGERTLFFLQGGAEGGKYFLRMLTNAFGQGVRKACKGGVRLCEIAAKLKENVFPRVVFIGVVGEGTLVVYKKDVVRIKSKFFTVDD